MRTKYQKIKTESTKLQEETEQSQNQIEKLKEKFDILKDQIRLSSAKQEAAHLLDQLHDLEMKRSNLEDENKNKLSPAEEREYLLKQAKENNQEIATIEKQLIKLIKNFGR
jgi:intraflagellar transport protein 74